MNNLIGKTFSLIGRSGSGKGVQGELLEKFLREQDYAVLRLVMGDYGRQLAGEPTVIGRLVKEALAKGGLFPTWLALSILVEAIEDLLKDKNQILIIDGAPRRLPEAQIIDELMTDIGRSPLIPIYLDVSEDECRKRLQLRARGDDRSLINIDKRLSWFKTETVSVLDYYSQRAVKINGEGDIEQIHDSIKNSIGN